MQPAHATVEVASRLRRAGRSASSRARAWLALLLLALLGAQWLALAHRTVHAFGVANRAAHAPAARGDVAPRLAAPGPAVLRDASLLSRAFDDHPAAGADCLRLDSLLGADPVPGATPTPCVPACPDVRPDLPCAPAHLAFAVRAPPARAPPTVLA